MPRALIVTDSEELGCFVTQALDSRNLTPVGQPAIIDCSREMLKEWRDDVREKVEEADVAILIATKSAFKLQAFSWVANLIRQSECPAIPLLGEKLERRDLQKLFSHPNLLWEESLPIRNVSVNGVTSPEAIDWTSQLIKAVKSAASAKHEVAKRLTAREILEKIRMRVPTHLLSEDVANDPSSHPVFASEIGHRSLDGEDARTQQLTVPELRELRVSAFASAIDAHIAEIRRVGILDKVDCSIFAPTRLSRNMGFKIQTMLHRADQLADAALLIDWSEQSTRRHLSDNLTLHLRRGTQVQLELFCHQLEVRERTRTVTWNGTARAVAWSIEPLNSVRDTPIRARIEATVHGIIIGQVDFELPVNEHQRPATADMMAMLTGDARAFRNAFISYAHADFEKVSYFAEGLEDAGIETLFDKMTMRSGVDWQKWIETSIPSVDVFYLMWSISANNSSWVHRECAIADKSLKETARPTLVPKLLERPVPKLPHYLSHLHASAKYLNMRLAERHPLFV